MAQVKTITYDSYQIAYIYRRVQIVEKQMKISISGPQNWYPKSHEANFKFDEPKTNQKEVRKFLQYKTHNLIETIKDASLIRIPKHMDYDGQQVHEIGLVREGAEKPNLYYAVKFIEHVMFGLNCITQIKVWYRGGYSGITRHVFYDKLLEEYDAAVTDKMQSADGRRFWDNQIREAFERGKYFVYYICLENNSFNQIKSVDDFEQVIVDREPWGDAIHFRNRRLMISKVEL